MRHSLLSIAVFSLIPSFTFADEYLVFYLGGQSNMDGYGLVQQLPEDLKKGLEDVLIFHGNTAPDGKPEDGRGTWAKLQPGHGVGFQSDGKTNKYSGRFGVELTFALTLRSAYPDKKIALIKYSRGGTSIDQRAAGRFGCWEPDFEGGTGDGKGINQYDHFLATIRNASSDHDIDEDGKPDTLVPTGIVWMQGESDATVNEDVAKLYTANLKRLMNLIRAALRKDDLPVVVGRISDSNKDKTQKTWTWGEQVRQAQADFVAQDGYSKLVTSTDNYGYSDPWHYDSAGYIDLGRQFARAMLELCEK